MWLLGLTLWERPFPVYVIFQWSTMLYAVVRMMGYLSSHIMIFSDPCRYYCRIHFLLGEMWLPCACIFTANGPLPDLGRLLPIAFMFYHFLWSPVLPLWLLDCTRYLRSYARWFNPIILILSRYCTGSRWIRYMFTVLFFMSRGRPGCYCVPQT